MIRTIYSSRWSIIPTKYSRENTPGGYFQAADLQLWCSGILIVLWIQVQQPRRWKLRWKFLHLIDVFNEAVFQWCIFTIINAAALKISQGDLTSLHWVYKWAVLHNNINTPRSNKRKRVSRLLSTYCVFLFMVDFFFE